ncbi:hypothetical protein HWV62_40603 [Athelia sp. TMB]|nr:hypothetical protein HWV62_40603 [Athelia sp. TMB]
MLSAQIVLASLVAGLATANPVQTRDADCTTIASGYLAANATGVFKTFYLNAENQVAYLGDGKNPLAVDFKECQSLEVNEPVTSQKSGVIYVPSHDKCISITNQPNAAGPYYTNLTTCGGAFDIGYPQRWVLDEDSSNAIRWSGESDEEGSILQGGCGLLGYASHSKGVPTITHSNSQITIEALSIQRRKLLLQLKELDAHAAVVLFEHNKLHNLDAPTSDLPDEMLAMIFEMGMRAELVDPHGTNGVVTFSALVSHVSHRWRRVALASPNLWSTIQCFRTGYVEKRARNGDEDEDGEEITIWKEQKGWRDRTAIHFFRSKSVPLDIHIKGLRAEDITAGLLHLFSGHAAHCENLFIERVHADVLPLLLKSFSYKPLPLLTSFGLVPDIENLGPMGPMVFPSRFLSDSAPRLITVEFTRLQAKHLRLCVPAFSTLTSLRLVDVLILGRGCYELLGKILMDLKVLNQLELELEWVYPDLPYPLPTIFLPTVRFLYVATSDQDSNVVDTLISCIHAASLDTLSLSGWQYHRDWSTGFHFPQLKHLILIDISYDRPIPSMVAVKFPLIERLTVQAAEFAQPYCLVGLMLADIVKAADYQCADNDTLNIEQRWPYLHTIATLGPIGYSRRKHVDKELSKTIALIQDSKLNVRTLLMPQYLFDRASAELIKSLQKFVKLETFYDDWPDPFSGSRTIQA